MQYKRVTHVIFDLDGLIIDSESISDQVTAEIGSKFGKELTKDLKLKTMGTPAPVSAQIIIEEMGLPYTADQFLEIYNPKVIELLHHPKLMPGAKNLIEHLHKNKIPMAIATSSSQDVFDIKTQDYKNLVSLFHHVVCGSTDTEVKSGKPAPDIFLICASRFPDKPEPNQCLVFEDSPNGVVGAAIAGMQVVMVPTPEVPEEMRAAATVVLKSLEEFKPEDFGLPGFER